MSERQGYKEEPTVSHNYEGQVHDKYYLLCLLQSEDIRGEATIGRKGLSWLMVLEAMQPILVGEAWRWDYGNKGELVMVLSKLGGLEWMRSGLGF